MALGQLIHCIEEIEIEGIEEKFLEGYNYLLVQQSELNYIINRHHESFVVTNEILLKHFIIKQ